MMVICEIKSGETWCLGDEGVANTRSGIGRTELDIISNTKLISGSLDGFDCKRYNLEFK